MLRSLSLLTLLLAVPAFAQPAVVGDWRGDLDVSALMPNVGTLGLIYHITADNDTLSATMDSPDQGAFGLPLETASFDGETRLLTVAAPSQQILFTGTLSPDGTQIEGTFQQGGRDFPLVLTPYEAPAETASARPKASAKARGDYSGEWLGTMAMPGGGELRLTFTLARGEDGGYTALLDAPGQAENLDLGAISVGGKDVVIDIMGQASFTGTISDDETMMDGTFAQGDEKQPMTLVRQ